MVCAYGIEWESKDSELPNELKIHDMQQAFSDRPEPVISCSKDEIVRMLTEWYGFNIVSVKGICYETEDGLKFSDVAAYEQYNMRHFF